MCIRLLGPEPPTTAASHGYVSRETPCGTDTTARASRLATGNVRIADTSALSTGGTVVSATFPLEWDAASGLAHGATIYKEKLNLRTVPASRMIFVRHPPSRDLLMWYRITAPDGTYEDHDAASHERDSIEGVTLKDARGHALKRYAREEWVGLERSVTNPAVRAR